MSSVLKALKKLEEEQRGEDVAAAAAGHQRWASGGQPPRRPRVWLLAIASLAVALLAVLVLLWPRRSDPPVAVATPPAAAVKPVAAVPAAVPGQSPPPANLDRPAPVVAPETARGETVSPSPAASPMLVVADPPPKAMNTAPPPAPSPVAVSPGLSGASKGSPPVQAVEPVVRQEAPVRQVKVNRFDIPSPGQEWVAPPQFTVSEIFPPTGGERMAIVNGLPVMVGTMVEEAMVEEILNDRVIVSIGGKQVSIPLKRGR